MKTSLPMRYHLLVYRREQLWLPLGLWALFALVVTLFRGETRVLDISGGFLGVVLPLLAGILATSAIVDDAALELQLAAPRAPWRMLIERLALILGIVALAALTFEVFLALVGIDIAMLGNLASRQLVWLVPSLSMMGLASLVALGFVQGTVGVLAVGLVWLIQLLLRDWFMASEWARYIFLYLGSRVPDSPDLGFNYGCLTGLAFAFVSCAALLLKKEERYL